MKEEILQILRQTPDFVSGQIICSRLGISRTAVWKAINTLREEGYAIDSVRNRGYRLSAATGHLSAEEILHYLSGHPWAGLLQVKHSVSSTSRLAEALAEQGAPEGTVVIADRQSDCRGRMGQLLYSPPAQGVYLSVILRPHTTANHLGHLICAAAEAICQAIEVTTGRRPGIKWPNDLICGRRKVADIQTQLAAAEDDGAVHYAVVGASVNCNQTEFPQELAGVATSLSRATGAPVDRNRLAGEMVLALHNMGGSLLDRGVDWVEAYRQDCITLGKSIMIQQGQALRQGTALDVDSCGALVADFGYGVEKLQAGKMSIRGLYGYL